MKRIAFSSVLVVLFILVCGMNGMGQIPQTLSYQGVLTDDSGNAVSDGTRNLTFKLYDTATDGTQLWTETQSVDVSNGLFNVILGSVTALTLDFDWCDQAVTIWRLAEAGAPFGLKITLLKTADLGVEIYLPAIFLNPFPLPDVSGDKAKRTFSVSAKAQAADVTNTTSGTTKYAINVVGLNSESSI